MIILSSIIIHVYNNKLLLAVYCCIQCYTGCPRINSPAELLCEARAHLGDSQEANGERGVTTGRIG